MLKNLPFKTKNILFIGIILSLAQLIYFNSLLNEIVRDDIAFIVNNEFIKDWRNIFLLFSPKYYLEVIPNIHNVARPVWILSAIFDYAIWGLNPAGHHLTNVILHGINSVLVYMLVLFIFKNIRLGFITGLIFAIHPVHTESVNVVSFRTDLLVVLFCLTGFLFYIRSTFSEKQRNRLIYFFAANIFYILGLLSKGMAITLPALFILYDYYFISDCSYKQLKKRIKWYIPYFVLIVAYLVFRGPRFLYSILPEYHHTIYTNPLVKIYTMSKVIAYYIKLHFIPFKLYADYTSFPISYSIRDIAVILSIVFLIAWIYVAVYLSISNRGKVYSFAIFWFFITIVPVSNIIPIFNIAAERYLYFPSIGFCLLFAALLEKKTKARLAVLFLTICIFSIIVVKRNTDWRDNYSLWSRTVKDAPNSVIALTNLGNIYLTEGQYDEAISLYNKALKQHEKNEKVGNITRNPARIYNSLGWVYYKKKVYDKAIDNYKRSLEFNPCNTLALNDLGTIYVIQKKYDDAVNLFYKGIEIDPDNPSFYYNLGQVYLRCGMKEKAEEYFKKAKEFRGRS